MSLKNPKRGQRIRITQSGRGYDTSKIYTVVRVDSNDSTLIGEDGSGAEGSWIHFSACVAAGPEIGWDWLKTQLPGEVLELLSAFSGLEDLRLKSEVRNHILLQVPNLKERILHTQVALEDEFGAMGDTEEKKEEDPFDAVA